MTKAKTRGYRQASLAGGCTASAAKVKPGSLLEGLPQASASDLAALEKARQIEGHLSRILTLQAAMRPPSYDELSRRANTIGAPFKLVARSR